MSGFVFEGFVVERGGEGMHAHFTLKTVGTGTAVYSEDSGAEIQFWPVNTAISLDAPLEDGTLPLGRLN
jgi:hypothetical protein